MRRDQTLRGLSFCAVAILLLLLAALGTPSYAQAPQRGTILGAVTANQGAVRGFRVTAHNLSVQIWYVVFTKDGHYTVPQALPGSYEVSVLQEGYDSPTQKISLGEGQTQTANLSVKRRVPDPDVTYLDYDQLYPPGAGRDLLEKNCMGCHGLDFYNSQHRTEAGWRAGINIMFNGPSFHDAPMFARNQFTAAEKDTIAKYLAANFGADSTDRQLKHDPYLVDEDALSKAIYVEYDAPDMPLVNKTSAKPAVAPVSYGNPSIGSAMTSGISSGEDGPIMTPAANAQVMHDTKLAADGHVWVTAANANEIVQLDPKAANPNTRYKQYPIQSPEAPRGVYPHGITINHEGHIFWAETMGGRVGELDPETGKMKRHRLPTEGSILQVVTDQKDNVWYTQIQGSSIGVVDGKTGRVSQWGTPTVDSDPYGMAIDQKGNVWTGGIAKGLLIKFDPVLESFTEYTPPTKYAGVRRVGVDSKGLIWFSEFRVSQIGYLNPDTGEMKEYKLPMKYSHPYDAWPDMTDNIWFTDHFNDSLIKFDQNTKKATYYPLPQLAWSIPKIEVEKNNTIWFGSRGVPNVVTVHFYPNGYSAAAMPEP